jgi:WD40 repeat protein
MQDGVRGWVRRGTQAGGGALRKSSPTALVSLLSASALCPLLAAGTGLTDAVAVAGVGVLSSVGGGVLGAVLTDSLDRMRERGVSSEPEVTEEVAGQIQHALAAGDSRAHTLLAEIATLLREIDAGGTALRAAIETGGQRISDDIAVALGELGGDFAELDFLIRDVEAAATEIQRTLDEQGAVVRGIAQQNYRQSTEIRVVREILTVIESRTRPGAAGGGRAPHWVDGCPYRGLLPFEASDEAVFYGRERLTAELAVRVTRGGIIVVTGASGAGKSSLVRAGLVPALTRGQQVAGSASWPCRVITPTADPLSELAVTLATLGGGSTLPIRDSLTRSAQEAHLLVRQAVTADAITRAGGRPPAGADDARLVLVVDQFEQLFTLCPDPDGEARRVAFIAALCSAATGATGRTGSPPAVVMIVVRGDFWDRCAAYPQLVSQMQEGHFVVGPMTPAELRLAITGPAEAAGLSLDGALTDTIVRDLHTVPEDAIGALPLLSQAMLLTWQNREGDRLTHRGYALSGGVSLAVQTSADAIYQGLTRPRQFLARRMLLAMTAVGRDGRITRRPVDRADLYAVQPRVVQPRVVQPRVAQPRVARSEVDAILEAFVDGRLIVLNDGTAQFAHDALLWAWPKLRDWLAEDQASWVLHAQLADAAARWRERHHDVSFLYRGDQLVAVKQAAAQWAADPGRFPVITAAEQDFLRASDHAAARGARQRRAVATLLVMLLIASIAGAGIAVSAARTADGQRSLADQQRGAAVAAQFATQSEALDGADPAEAAQLAASAWRLSPGPDARDSLLDAYAQPDHGVMASGGGMVQSVAFTPDSGLLATGSSDGIIRLWNVGDGQLIGPAMKVRIYAGEQDHGGVESVAFSPDGKILATASVSGVVQFWSVADHRPIGAAINVPGGISGDSPGGGSELAFSPAGNLIAVAGLDGTVGLWSVATHRPAGSPILVAGAAAGVGAYQVAFSPSGKVLATANGQGVVQLWTVATRDQDGAPIAAAGGVPAVLSALAFSPDGSELAVIGGTDGTAALWSVATRQPVGAPFGDDLTALAFSPDGTLLATAGSDGLARLWYVTSHQLDGPAIGVNATVNALAFSPDGRFLATAGQDDDARLWSVSVFRQVGTPLAAGGNAYDVRFSPNGALVATAGADGLVRLYSAATHRQVGGPIVVVPPAGEAGVNAVAFSPDGRLLATGDGTGAARLWSVASRREIGPPLEIPAMSGDSNSDGVEAIAFDPSGNLLALADASGTVLLWNVDTYRQAGKPIQVAAGTFPNVDAVAFSPDGRLLATSAYDGTVRFWNVATHREIGAPVSFGSGITVQALAFSPDETLLATGASDGAVRLVSVSTHRETGVVLTQSGPVDAMSFSRDGSTLATGAGDGTARLWDTGTGQQIGPTLSADDGDVYAVAFSPDGSLLATASQDGTARLWDVGFPADLLGAVCGIAGEMSLTIGEWDSFTSLEPYRRACS